MAQLFLYNMMNVKFKHNNYDGGIAIQTAVETCPYVITIRHVNRFVFLGCLYEDGQGMAQDYEEAVKWYSLAAEQGDAMAQCNLGHLYADEQTGNQNFIKAHKWFNIAGTKEREAMEKLMNPNQIAEAQKLAKEWVKKHIKNN